MDKHIREEFLQEGLFMAKITITERRCRRCGKLHTDPLPDTDQHREQNLHRLCDSCTKWQQDNQEKKIK